MLRVERLEIGVGRWRRRNLGQHNFRVEQGGRLIDEHAEHRGIDATAAGKARILQNRKLELDLGDRLVVGVVGEIARRRQLKGGSPQPPVIRLADLVAGRLSLGREPHAGNPHRRIAPLGVKGFERGEVLHISALAQ